jgi:hypothetical protein
VDQICADESGVVHAANISPAQRRSLALRKKALRAASLRRLRPQVEGLSQILTLALDDHGVVRAGKSSRDRVCAAEDGTIYAENIIPSPQQSEAHTKRKQALLEIREKRAVPAPKAHLAMALDAEGVVQQTECRRNRICADATGTIHEQNIVAKGPSQQSKVTLKLKEKLKEKAQKQVSSLPTLRCDLAGRADEVSSEIVVASNDGVIHDADIHPVTPQHQYSANLRAKKVHKIAAAFGAPTREVLCAHPEGYACELVEQPEPGWWFWNPADENQTDGQLDEPWLNCGSSCVSSTDVSSVDECWTLVY